MNRLYRSVDNRMIGGVAGGLAEYFQLDAVLVRLLFVIAAMFAGGGVLAYLVAWAVMPEKPAGADSQVVEYPRETIGPDGQPVIDISGPEIKVDERGRKLGAAILIGLGALLLLHQLMPYQFSRLLFPIVLIGLGIYVFTRDGGGGK